MACMVTSLSLFVFLVVGVVADSIGKGNRDNRQNNTIESERLFLIFFPVRLNKKRNLPPSPTNLNCFKIENEQSSPEVGINIYFIFSLLSPFGGKLIILLWGKMRKEAGTEF